MDETEQRRAQRLIVENMQGIANGVAELLRRQPAPPVPTPVDGELSSKTLGKLLGEIVGIAIVEQLKERHWFTNWRTMDDRDNWTADDFHQLSWPEDMGHIGGMCVDIVGAIKPKVKALIEDQSAAHLQAAVREACLATTDRLEHAINAATSYDEFLKVLEDERAYVNRQQLKKDGEQ